MAEIQKNIPKKVRAHLFCEPDFAPSGRLFVDDFDPLFCSAGGPSDPGSLVAVVAPLCDFFACVVLRREVGSSPVVSFFREFSCVAAAPPLVEGNLRVCVVRLVP